MVAGRDLIADKARFDLQVSMTAGGSRMRKEKLQEPTTVCHPRLSVVASFAIRCLSRACSDYIVEETRRASAALWCWCLHVSVFIVLRRIL